MAQSGQSKDILSFEAPLQEMRKRIDELLSTASDDATRDVIRPMQEQYEIVERKLYDSLSPWNTVEMARHPKRPQTRDYLELTFNNFLEIHGDRLFRDDPSIVAGLAYLGNHRVVVIGQHKGRSVEERHICHAGCPHPEGYRKALRAMKMAERHHLPVICLMDTKGAYPGIGSEERGVAIAIAENMLEMSQLRTPIVCVVIGEGGSGGALGIGVGDRVMMLQHAYYSVISPEGCASILWRDGEKKNLAAAVLGLTSKDLLGNGLIDDIVPEPLGGAHRNPQQAGYYLREKLVSHLEEIESIPLDQLLEQRYQKYRQYGRYLEHAELAVSEPEIEESDSSASESDLDQKSDIEQMQDLTESEFDASEDVDTPNSIDQDTEASEDYDDTEDSQDTDNDTESLNHILTDMSLSDPDVMVDNHFEQNTSKSSDSARIHDEVSLSNAKTEIIPSDQFESELAAEKEKLAISDSDFSDLEQAADELILEETDTEHSSDESTDNTSTGDETTPENDSTPSQEKTPDSENAIEETKAKQELPDASRTINNND